VPITHKHIEYDKDKDGNVVSHSVERVSYVKPSRMRGKAYSDGRKSIQEKEEEFNGYETFYPHHDEIAYREHLLSKDDEDKKSLHDAYVNKVKSDFPGFHPNYTSISSANADNEKYHNISKKLHERGAKTNQELHIEEQTEKGKKIEEDAKNKKDKDEQARKEAESEHRRSINEKYYDNLLERTKKFFDNMSEYDFGDMTIRDYYLKMFKDTSISRQMYGREHYPIDKSTKIVVKWKNKPESEGTMGQLVEWLKNKYDDYKNAGGSAHIDKVPFTSIHVKHYNEDNPFRREANDFD
jgi:hypothetical protein